MIRGKWSDSKHSCYKFCQRQFYYKYILRLKTKSKSIAMERGNLIHKKGEDYLLGKLKHVPKEFKRFKSQMLKLKESGANPEADVSVTYGWDISSMFQYNVWLRAKIDADYYRDDLVIIDFKTGGIYENKIVAQSETYGACASCHYDFYKDITVEFWYLDQESNAGPVKRKFIYTKKHLSDVKRKLKHKFNRTDKELAIMGSDITKYACSPSRLCGWCDFSHKNGGACEY